MRFFVPATNNSGDAEKVYGEIRERVTARTGPVDEKRIYRLKYQHEGSSETVVVGSDRHKFGAGPVVAIFRGSDGQHYICTQRSAASDVEQHALPSSAIVEAEDFSALA